MTTPDVARAEFSKYEAWLLAESERHNVFVARAKTRRGVFQGNGAEPNDWDEALAKFRVIRASVERALAEYAAAVQTEERARWLDEAARIEAEIAADPRHTAHEIAGAHFLGAALRAAAAPRRAGEKGGEE